MEKMCLQCLFAFFMWWMHFFM